MLDLYGMMESAFVHNKPSIGSQSDMENEPTRGIKGFSGLHLYI